jgi:hypothetical protein
VDRGHDLVVSSFLQDGTDEKSPFKTEWEIRKFLQDHHGTFSIFARALAHAGKEIEKLPREVSVPLYVHDLRNPEFVPLLEKEIGR